MWQHSNKRQRTISYESNIDNIMCMYYVVIRVGNVLSSKSYSVLSSSCQSDASIPEKDRSPPMAEIAPSKKYAAENIFPPPPHPSKKKTKQANDLKATKCSLHVACKISKKNPPHFPGSSTPLGPPLLCPFHRSPPPPPKTHLDWRHCTICHNFSSIRLSICHSFVSSFGNWRNFRRVNLFPDICVQRVYVCLP